MYVPRSWNAPYAKPTRDVFDSLAAMRWNDEPTIDERHFSIVPCAPP